MPALGAKIVKLSCCKRLYSLQSPKYFLFGTLEEKSVKLKKLRQHTQWCCCSVTKQCVTLCNSMNCVACQASLFFTISRSLLKLFSIESVMVPNLILCHPLLLLPTIFPSMRVFSNESALCIGGLSSGASASVLPMNIQG